MMKVVLFSILLFLSSIQGFSQVDNIELRTQDIQFLANEDIAKKGIRLRFRYDIEIEDENYGDALLTLDSMYAHAKLKGSTAEELKSFDGNYTECFLKMGQLQRSYESLFYQSEHSDFNIVKPTWQYLRANYTLPHMKREFVHAIKHVETDYSGEENAYFVYFFNHKIYLTEYHLALANNKPHKLRRIYRKLHFFEMVK